MKLTHHIGHWLIGAVLMGGLGAQAAPITFLHSGTGSGDLDGTTFTRAAFTITATGDTDSVQSCGSECIFLDHLSASIDIAGVGVFSFVTATRTFIADFADLVGFSRAGAGGSDLYNGPASAALDGYDLATSIGPLAGTGSLLQWGSGFGDVLTSAGVLRFDNGSGAGTFQAITGSAVPEPGTLPLVAAVLLAWGATRRRPA